MTNFELSLANDKIWEIQKLIKFLCDHSGQDIFLSVNPEAHDLAACGLYDLLDCFDFQSVTIETSNCLEKHSKYHIVKRPVDQFLSKKYWANFDLSSSGIWTQEKIFGVFYGRPTANRIGIASYLFTHHFDNSHIVFAADIQNPDSRQLFEIDKLFEYRAESIKDFGSMISNNYHTEIEYTKFGHQYNPCTPLHDGYRSILIDIISEPNIEGTTFYPTEKFSRCVLMRKPFIVMASSNYLNYLAQMGFRTFFEFWSERYDGFASHNRFTEILKVIDDIANRPHNQLVKMYHNMKEILDYNYNLLVSQKYRTSIKGII